MPKDRFGHIFIEKPPERLDFKKKGGGPKKAYAKRDRIEHGNNLRDMFDKAWRDAQEQQAAVAHVERNGMYIEFMSEPGFDLALDSLDLTGKGIRLLNVRTVGPADNLRTYATVFIPKERKSHYLNKIKAYLTEDGRGGKPKNYTLLDNIANILRSFALTFWVDDMALFPDTTQQWCEVWLSSESGDIIAGFREVLQENGVESKEGDIKFPERTVLCIKANAQQLENLVLFSDHIAEFRRAKETAVFFTEMQNAEQAKWVEELLSRLHIKMGNVAVCVLDTGINNSHPLLSRILNKTDCLTVDSTWGTNDHMRHGTLMAGIIAMNDLKGCLESSGTILIEHSLESVKILPPHSKNEAHLWGYITSQAVSLATVNAPDKTRIICMAVTSDDPRQKGRPTSWSAAVDRIAAGVDHGKKLLIILSAGNVPNSENYPAESMTTPVEDPAHSWNALTVGAFTELSDISQKELKGYQPLAPSGGLSPFSPTSLLFDKEWPIKPEILMEGGNLAISPSKETTECDDLSLLTTDYLPQESYFGVINATSAAAAKAAWFAAQLQLRYPNAWPETIRALMVHSAEWTETMKGQFLPRKDNKTAYGTLLRICGYGVPNLENALFSAANQLTLVAQEEIQPYDKEKGSSGYKTKEMHLHELPWPREILENLPFATDVSMRITLSYFIEPGPSQRGWKNRYRYPSHGLRFELKTPTEEKEQFLVRINKAIQYEELEGKGDSTKSDRWLIGPQSRNKGSIQSDIWRGTAADLATSNLIAVYPIIGWWRERHHLERWDSKGRYSLVVSISTPAESVDLYTAVAAQVGIAIPILPQI